MASSCFAITPSPRHAATARAVAADFVSGVSSTEPVADFLRPGASAISFFSASRRSANGSFSSFVLPSASRSKARKSAGVCSASILTRDSAGCRRAWRRVEHLAAVVVEDDQLAVDHVAALGQHQLGEVAQQRLAAAGLQVDLVAVDEGERAEAVVLGLVGPLLALGQGLARERELGLDRRLRSGTPSRLILGWLLRIASGAAAYHRADGAQPELDGLRRRRRRHRRAGGGARAARAPPRREPAVLEREPRARAPTRPAALERRHPRRHLLRARLAEGAALRRGRRASSTRTATSAGSRRAGTAS